MSPGPSAILRARAGMAESVDAADSKSAALKSVWVRVPLPAPDNKKARHHCLAFLFSVPARSGSTLLHALRVAASRVKHFAVLRMLRTGSDSLLLRRCHFARGPSDRTGITSSKRCTLVVERLPHAARLAFRVRSAFTHCTVDGCLFGRKRQSCPISTITGRNGTPAGFPLRFRDRRSRWFVVRIRVIVPVLHWRAVTAIGDLHASQNRIRPWRACYLGM